MIRDEIAKLIERGNITLDEYEKLRCSSEEWNALVPALAFDALEHATKHVLANCTIVKEFPGTYDEAVCMIYAPELLRRLKQHVEDVENSVLLREMQSEIDALADQMKYVEKTVSALEMIEMLGENKKRITGTGSIFDRIRLLVGHR